VIETGAVSPGFARIWWARTRTCASGLGPLPQRQLHRSAQRQRWRRRWHPEGDQSSGVAANAAGAGSPAGLEESAAAANPRAGRRGASLRYETSTTWRRNLPGQPLAAANSAAANLASEQLYLITDPRMRAAGQLEATVAAALGGGGPSGARTANQAGRGNQAPDRGRAPARQL